MNLSQLFADHYWDSFEADKELILKHVDAVLTLYAAQLRKNCKHYSKIGNGSASSDGSGSYSWYCPACGASESYSTPRTPVGSPPNGGDPTSPKYRVVPWRGISTGNIYYRIELAGLLLWREVITCYSEKEANEILIKLRGWDAAMSPAKPEATETKGPSA